MSYNKSSSLQCTQIEKEGIYAYQFNGGQSKEFQLHQPMNKTRNDIIGKRIQCIAGWMRKLNWVWNCRKIKDLKGNIMNRKKWLKKRSKVRSFMYQPGVEVTYNQKNIGLCCFLFLPFFTFDNFLSPLFFSLFILHICKETEPRTVDRTWERQNGRVSYHKICNITNRRDGIG